MLYSSNTERSCGWFGRSRDLQTAFQFSISRFSFLSLDPVSQVAQRDVKKWALLELQCYHCVWELPYYVAHIYRMFRDGLRVDGDVFNKNRSQLPLSS